MAFDWQELLDALFGWLTWDLLLTAQTVLVRLALIAVAALLALGLTKRVLSAVTGRLAGRSRFFSTERTAALRSLMITLTSLVVAIIALLAALIVVGIDVGVIVSGTVALGYVHAVLIIVAAHVIVRIGTMLIEQFFERADEGPLALDSRRAVTLSGLANSILRYTVNIAAILMALSQVGFNTAALLASVGVAGLAIAFGAQNLIRDMLAGFFLLFENQFQVGDLIAAAGVNGYVQEVGLRVTKIKDFSGAVHIIPNGRIEQVANFSKEPMRVMVEVRVPYEIDLRQSIAVVQSACDRFIGDDRVVDPPRVLGVGELAESSVNLLVWGYTHPDRQWAVERELRLAIKSALDAAGIKVPYPRRVLVAAQLQQEG